MAVTRTRSPRDLSIDFCGCVAGEIPYAESEWPVRKCAWPYDVRFFLCLFMLSLHAFAEACNLDLQMMSRGFLQAEIDKLHQFSEYSQVVKELPPTKEELAKQKKLETERKKGAKKQKVSASTSAKSSQPKAAALEKFEEESEGPAINMGEYAALIGKGLAVAEQYNLADMAELTKLNVHLTENGGWELFPHPKRWTMYVFSF